MQNECIICLTNIDNNNECNSIYNFHQECDCFYNVHSKCLIEWVNKYNTCIHCHKPLSYSLKPDLNTSHIPFRTHKVQKNKCCTIL